MISRKKLLAVVMIILALAIVAGFLVLRPNNYPTREYALQLGIPDNSNFRHLDSSWNSNNGTKEKVILDFAAKLNASYQETFLNSLLSLNNTNDEYNQVLFLSVFPLNEQLNCIVNGSASDVDWDKDNMNNRFEQVSQMPWDVYNGRYALIVYTEPTNGDYLANFLVNNENFNQSNVIKLNFKDATFDNFNREVAKLSEKVGTNDIVLITLNGHGNNDIFGFNDGKGNAQGPDGSVNYSEIAQKIEPLNAWKTLIINSACYSETGVDILGNGKNVVAANLEPHCIFELNVPKEQASRSAYPANVDSNGDGFPSISEIINFANEKQGYAVIVSDRDNIVQNFYLGDFSVRDLDP
jgi:hypothetical protein